MFKIIRIILFSTLCAVLHLDAQETSIKSILSQVEEGRVVADDAWLITKSSDTIYYSSLKGKGLLLNYWTTGCKPCIKGFPKLNQISRKLDSTSIQIVGVYVGKDIGRWKKASEKYGIAFPNFYGGWTNSNPLLTMNFKLSMDKDGNFKLITETPQYVLIDPTGKIVDKQFVSPTSRQFETRLRSYL